MCVADVSGRLLLEMRLVTPFDRMLKDHPTVKLMWDATKESPKDSLTWAAFADTLEENEIEDKMGLPLITWYRGIAQVAAKEVTSAAFIKWCGSGNIPYLFDDPVLELASAEPTMDRKFGGWWLEKYPERISWDIFTTEQCKGRLWNVSWSAREGTPFRMLQDEGGAPWIFGDDHHWICRRGQQYVVCSLLRPNVEEEGEVTPFCVSPDSGPPYRMCSTGTLFIIQEEHGDGIYTVRTEWRHDGHRKDEIECEGRAGGLVGVDGSS